METTKLSSFRNLSVWRKAGDLAVLIYSATEKFPKSELYGLTSQMRRAAVSISSNLAEGWKRIHKKEKMQFYSVAHGSAAELESQIEIARRLGFLADDEYGKSLSLTEEVSKMINGLIKSLTSRLSLLNPQAGFTLVEVIVAIALFSVVVSIAAGGFVTALRSQRQVAALIAADNNVSLVLEQMARELRTGYNVCRPGENCFKPSATNCPALSPVTVNELDFYNADSQGVIYRLNGDVIERAEQDANGNFVFSPLTGNNVSVKYLNFTLSGNLSGDCWPPRVTISLGLSSKDSSVAGDIINIQTTISARQLDS